MTLTLVPIDTPALILCLVFLGIILLLLYYPIRKLHHIFYGKRPKTEKLSWGMVPMLPESKKVDIQLQAQGFRPLGIVKSFFPPTNAWANAWIYANEEGTIWVEAVQLSADDPVLVQYGSLFRNQAMIHTRFPRGEVITTPRYHSRFAANDLDGAYQYHVQILNEWQSRNGDLHKVEALDDTDRPDQIYHEKYRAADLRAIALVTILQLSVGLTAVLMVLAFIMFGLEALPLFVDKVFLITVLLGIFSLLIIPKLTNSIRYRAANAVDRKQKPKHEPVD